MNKVDSQQARAVVLVSGGLDSATALAMANERGRECYAISINYGQRHHAELKAAQRVCHEAAVADHRIIHIGLDQIGGSALTDMAIDVPESGGDDIPVTYVPARNTIMLSLALGYAEVVQACEIYIGVNAVDYSGYPDCRPEFIAAYQELAKVATAGAVGGAPVSIEAPLLTWSKAQIIQEAARLGVDLSLTVSCYQADAQGRACGHCDSCHLRREGFLAAGVEDPTLYV